MRIRIDWALLGEQFPVLLFDLMKVNSMTFVLRSCPQPVKIMEEISLYEPHSIRQVLSKNSEFPWKFNPIFQTSCWSLGMSWE